MVRSQPSLGAMVTSNGQEQVKKTTTPLSLPASNHSKNTINEFVETFGGGDKESFVLTRSALNTFKVNIRPEKC
ncbi:unnamed protein product [Pleuronectes platessa]|uniref:Uncharacterized protein n=1 Tax=Pleuronectes platessa TaxID=8262 RepID=A0A9N7YZA1_PLEPL|nr:unnamed protein product [Pleuronectes platessa]